jgi:hypothetical protein
MEYSRLSGQGQIERKTGCAARGFPAPLAQTDASHHGCSPCLIAPHIRDFFFATLAHAASAGIGKSNAGTDCPRSLA